jgi:hypothetical protein
MSYLEFRFKTQNSELRTQNSGLSVPSLFFGEPQERAQMSHMSQREWKISQKRAVLVADFLWE